MRVVYGIHPVEELLRAGGQGLVELWLAEGAAGPALPALEQQARRAGAKVQRAPRAKLDALCEGERHQGVVAVLSGGFAYAELPDVLEAARAAGESPLLVILDGVEDPHHLGAIARSAVALGAHGLIIPRDRAVGVTPVAMKASAGILARCPVVRVVNVSRIIDELKASGVWSVALTADGDRDLSELDLTGPTALVLGGEGEGIRPLVRKTCDHSARVGMRSGVESLSVSSAAAISLYEAARQRGRRRG